MKHHAQHMTKPEYHLSACVDIVCGVLEQAVGEYKLICKSGWLEGPFKLREGALKRLRRGNEGRCGLNDNQSAIELMLFFSGDSMDRMISAANIKIDANRVRKQLTNFYHQHNEHFEPI